MLGLNLATPLRREAGASLLRRGSKLRALPCQATQAVVPSAMEAAQPERLILGIESSCDDTGAAVISSHGRVLGEALAGQADLHAPWGGVVPSLAREAHQAAIDRVVEDTLVSAGKGMQDLDAVAVTVGPGLSMCLKVGVVKARGLAAKHGLPLVKVHHMEAHALVSRLHAPVPFPFLCLLVSGGHNLLLLAHGVGNYTLLGTTVDDAMGEAFDKVARLLGLDLKPNGGAALEKFARKGDPNRFKFTVPLRQQANCNFSFAGLKTAISIAIQKEGLQVPSAAAAAGGASLDSEAASKPAPDDGVAGGAVSPAAAAAATADGASAAGGTAAALTPTPAADGGAEKQSAAESSQPSPSQPSMDVTADADGSKARQTRADIAASFQRVAVQHLLDRCKRGVDWARDHHPDLKRFVIAGGVACNRSVRSSFGDLAEALGLELTIPDPHFCTDNGAMVAWAGLERFNLGLFEGPPQSITDDDAYQDVKPRWPLTNISDSRGLPKSSRGLRIKRLHTSLTELTAAAMADTTAKKARGEAAESDAQAPAVACGS
ncbi:hypothetical protein WJX74_002536 [Apatococcus lobatus]|uniref:Glycoprotease 1 n=1 Tax=Apatococcus lobatus TaxID=904363 RepID=A0AAW1S1G4_9CHLO